MVITSSLVHAVYKAVLRKPPEVEWYKVYNASEEVCHPHYVIETTESGLLMVGETEFIGD
jgi:hypothetical protein